MGSLPQYFIREFNTFTEHINFHVAQLVKKVPANAGDLGSIPGSGRSPGEGNSY